MGPNAQRRTAARCVATHSSALRRQMAGGRHRESRFTFYFDFISPYAWLGVSGFASSTRKASATAVHYHPVLFGGLCSSTMANWAPHEIARQARLDLSPSAMWRTKQQGTRLANACITPVQPFGTRCAWQWPAPADGDAQSLCLSKPFSSTCGAKVGGRETQTAWPPRSALLSQASLQGVAKDPQSDDVSACCSSGPRVPLQLGLFGVPAWRSMGKCSGARRIAHVARLPRSVRPSFQSSAWRDVSQLPVGIRRAPEKSKSSSSGLCCGGHLFHRLTSAHTSR